MCIKVLIYAIMAVVSLMSFEAVHQGLVVFEGWPTPSYGPSAPTPPPKPRKPNANDFVTLFNAAEIFNSSHLLPPDPVYKHLFYLGRCKARVEDTGKSAPVRPTWWDLLSGLVHDLLLCELRLYWWMERIFWLCLLGQHVKRDLPEVTFEESSVNAMIAHGRGKAVESLESEKKQLVGNITKLQNNNEETFRLLETERDYAKRNADLLNEGKKQRDVEKKELNERYRETVASIRDKHDSQLTTLKSTQFAKVEQERKRHEAANTERQEQRRLEEIRAEARQKEVEHLREESAELRQNVASIQEEHDGKIADLKSAQLAEMEEERKKYDDEHNKLLSKVDDLEQRNAKLEHSKKEWKLDASEANASQVKVEQLRRASAALRKEVARTREEHDGRIIDLRSAQLKTNVALTQSEAKFTKVLVELEASHKVAAESGKELEELQKRCNKLETDKSDLTSKNQADVRAAEEKAKSLSDKLHITQVELLESKAANKTLGKALEARQVGKGLSASSWASGNDNPLGTGKAKQLEVTINELEKKIIELELKNNDQVKMLDKSYELAAKLGRDNYYLKDRMGTQALSPKARPYGSSNPYFSASSASAALPVSQANTLQSPMGQGPSLLYTQQQQPPLPPPQPIPQQNTPHQFPHLPWVPPNIQHQPATMPYAQHQQQHHYQPGSQHHPPNILPARQQQQQQQPRPEAPAFVPHRPPPRNVPSRQNRGHQDQATIDPANPGFLKVTW